MKKLSLSLDDIFNITGARIYNPDSFKTIYSVSIDSRKIKKNSLFVALKGERLDGHDFVKEVVNKGVTAVMIDNKKYKMFSSLVLPVITVDDTLTAYGQLANTWRKKLKAKVIGITGSAGKTTTKEMISSILSEKYKVNKTVSNYNNQIGVPLTILNTNASHEILVLELGTNHFGEIAYTANIAEPDFGLITNIGNSHLEFLRNKKGVLREKSELFKSVQKNNGTLFVNNDDSMVSNSVKNYKNKVTYSFSSKAEVKGKLKGQSKEGKEIIEIKYKDKTIDGAFYFGEQSAKNLLAASAVAFRLGLNKAQILNGIKKYKSVDKRLNIKKYKNHITLIDDTYNANPESMRYAFDLMNKISVGRKKIAVLGDMFELGSAGIRLHKNLSKDITSNKIDELLLIGDLMKNLKSQINQLKISVTHFRDRVKLKNYIKNSGLNNSVILVKGSRGMKMEEFVKTIEEKINA